MERLKSSDDINTPGYEYDQEQSESSSDNEKSEIVQDPNLDHDQLEEPEEGIIAMSMMQPQNIVAQIEPSFMDTSVFFYKNDESNIMPNFDDTVMHVQNDDQQDYIYDGVENTILADSMMQPQQLNQQGQLNYNSLNLSHLSQSKIHEESVIFRKLSTLQKNVDGGQNSSSDQSGHLSNEDYEIDINGKKVKVDASSIVQQNQSQLEESKVSIKINDLSSIILQQKPQEKNYLYQSQAMKRQMMHQSQFAKNMLNKENQQNDSMVEDKMYNMIKMKNQRQQKRLVDKKNMNKPKLLNIIQENEDDNYEEEEKKYDNAYDILSAMDLWNIPKQSQQSIPDFLSSKNKANDIIPEDNKADETIIQPHIDHSGDKTNILNNVQLSIDVSNSNIHFLQSPNNLKKQSSRINESNLDESNASIFLRSNSQSAQDREQQAQEEKNKLLQEKEQEEMKQAQNDDKFLERDPTQTKVRQEQVQGLDQNSEFSNQPWKQGEWVFKRYCGFTYEGKWLDRAIDGKGVAIGPNGIKVEANFENGNINGFVKIENPNIIKYAGDFKDWKRHGIGVLTWPNGQVYEGQFYQDSVKGKGIMKTNNNHVLEGQFNQGLLDGNGTYLWPNGQVYKGQFSKGLFEGQGKLTFVDPKCVYEGQFKQGVQSGHGTMTTQDGCKFIGTWESGMLQGPGSFINRKNVEKTGSYKDNKFTEFIPKPPEPNNEEDIDQIQQQNQLQQDDKAQQDKQQMIQESEQQVSIKLGKINKKRGSKINLKLFFSNNKQTGMKKSKSLSNLDEHNKDDLNPDKSQSKSNKKSKQKKRPCNIF